MAEAKRIMAHFQPQAWIHDYAVDIDGAYEFDITDQVLAMGKEAALALEDDDYDSDNLWKEHPVSTEKPHDGPFYVSVEEAIQKYFEEED